MYFNLEKKMFNRILFDVHMPYLRILNFKPTKKIRNEAQLTWKKLVMDTITIILGNYLTLLDFFFFFRILTV